MNHESIGVEKKDRNGPHPQGGAIVGNFVIFQGDERMPEPGQKAEPQG
jgi:hypothetical protein